MKQNIKDIVKYKYKKKNELKFELKKKILKSLMQNSNLKQVYKIFSMFKYTNYYKKIQFCKYKKICLLIGRKQGILKKFNLSRHQIKQLNILGQVTNIKIKSW